MKVVLTGEVVEIGNLVDSDGEDVGPGVRLEMEEWGETMSLPMPLEDCRAVGAFLYKTVRITVEIEEVSK
jgi:hypothetical protein